MGAFASKTEKIHADWWDADEYVIVKERSYADQQNMVMDNLPNRRMSAQDAKQMGRMMDDLQFDMGDVSHRSMLYSIASWTLKGPDGEVAPLTLDSIRALSAQSGDFIMEAVSRLNPQRDDDFPGGRGGGVPEREGAAAAGDDGGAADPGDGLDGS